MTNLRLLTAREVSQRTGLHVRTVYRLRLPWIQVHDRAKRVLEQDLIDYLNDHKQERPC